MKPIFPVARALRVGVALGASSLALVLSVPTESAAFSVTGTSLGLDQRSVRVFNNFTDATSNDNQTPHSEFPGALGATQAIWKGVVEWSSTLHGTGAGDPHQPFDLGSGGANFDPSFQGETDGPGGVDDNVISATTLPLGGVLVLIESGGTGWRMRFADSGFVFDDGPGTNVTGLDIQGIVARSYGQVLGLGTSAVSGATMSTVVDPVQARSLSADDQAGIQFVYGAAAPTKPRIDGVSVANGFVTISGVNFAPTGGEVWFTEAFPASGDPIVVGGVTSSAGGTEITLAIPPGAGPGDLLVRADASGGASLSNPWPYALAAAPGIASVTPPIVPVLAPVPRVVTVTGDSLDTVTEVRFGGVTVGAGGAFDGSFTVVSSNELEVELPVMNVPATGASLLELVGPGGMTSTAVDVVAAASPVIAIDQPDIVESVGLDFAFSSAAGDAIFLLVSPVLGPTTVPGVLDLEIGGGSFAPVFNLKGYAIGTTLLRTDSFGPFSGLTPGETVHFEGWVLEFANGYATPWESTNVETRTVTGP